jgi:hypothetical protein
MKWNVYMFVVGFLCLVVKKVALCLGYLADREVNLPALSNVKQKRLFDVRFGWN